MQLLSLYVFLTGLAMIVSTLIYWLVSFLLQRFEAHTDRYALILIGSMVGVFTGILTFATAVLMLYP
jgi:hypothetical protein